jgi:flagellar protein FliO/FliZ
VSDVAAAGLALDGILAPAAAAAGIATATQPATAQAQPATDAANTTTTQAGAGSDATQGKPATAWLPAQPARTGTTLHAGTTQPAHVPATSAPGTAGTIGGTLFALLFVLALIFALAWLAKRLPGVAGSSHRALRVVASLSLGPRERVVVVDVGGTQLLLGVGAGGTRALHTLDAPLPEAEAPRAPAFAQLLAQHFGKKP